MRSVLIALLLLPLAGCHSDPKPAAAKCIAKAKAESPRTPYQTEEEYTDSLGSSIGECMKAAGYVFEPAQDRCADGSNSNPECYTSKRTF
jgi:hypothetical protein